MNYFDYLRATKKEDTKESFKSYLIEFLNYSEETAEKEAKLYFKAIEENKTEEQK